MTELSAFGVIHKSSKAQQLGAGRKLVGPKTKKGLAAVKRMKSLLK